MSETAGILAPLEHNLSVVVIFISTQSCIVALLLLGWKIIAQPFSVKVPTLSIELFGNVSRMCVPCVSGQSCTIVEMWSKGTLYFPKVNCDVLQSWPNDGQFASGFVKVTGGTRIKEGLFIDWDTWQCLSQCRCFWMCLFRHVCEPWFVGMDVVSDRWECSGDI